MCWGPCPERLVVREHCDLIRYLSIKMFIHNLHPHDTCSMLSVYIFDRIAKQVWSMNWRKPSVRRQQFALTLAVAFSLVSHKPLMTYKSNLVSLLTWVSSSQPIPNLVTLTLTSRFSEHTLILTLPCSLSHN